MSPKDRKYMKQVASNAAYTSPLHIVPPPAVIIAFNPIVLEEDTQKDPIPDENNQIPEILDEGRFITTEAKKRMFANYTYFAQSVASYNKMFR